MRYCNPVCSHYLADPFVWRAGDWYYAIGTGPAVPKKHAEERDFQPIEYQGAPVVFPVFRSADLVDWEWVRPALVAPGFAVPQGVFWAPEVAGAAGRFHLYYSVATSGLNHQLRVAVSERPEGPYEDECALIGADAQCPFAIDGHPFCDTDGQWYLFYARDFLDTDGGCRAGTALAVDRLGTMTSLAGEDRVVLRARWDWQRFQANRQMYGGCYDWHTLEGPCVRKFGERYYCFFSGGCYEGESYGVDYAVADHVLGPYADVGRESGPRIVRTVPGRVIGPGHNSIVLGPDGKTDFLVYHAWDPQMTARRMCIDPVFWSEEGPRCAGPTWTAQTV